MDPVASVVIGTLIGGFIVWLMKGRKAKKALAKGECPECKGKIQDKNIAGNTVKLCPQGCGMISANGAWKDKKTVNKIVKGYKKKEDVPDYLATQWAVWQATASWQDESGDDDGSGDDSGDDYGDDGGGDD